MAVATRLAALIGGVVIVLLLIIGITLGIVFGSGGTSSSKGFLVIPGRDIVFTPGNDSTYEKYIAEMNEALKPYKEDGANRVDCDDERPEGKICIFRISYLDSCSDKHAFGFTELKPCVLLTFKDNPEYKPVEFDGINNLPEGMPEDLKTTIEEEYEGNDNVMVKQNWVHCNGTSNYFPQQGFMSHYFPTQDLEGYLPPLIAVPVDLTKKDEVYIECSLWSNSGTGVPDFELSFRIRKESS